MLQPPLCGTRSHLAFANLYYKFTAWVEILNMSRYIVYLCDSHDIWQRYGVSPPVTHDVLLSLVSQHWVTSYADEKSQAEVNDSNERSKRQVSALSVNRRRHKADGDERVVRRHVKTLNITQQTLWHQFVVSINIESKHWRKCNDRSKIQMSTRNTLDSDQRNYFARIVCS